MISRGLLLLIASLFVVLQSSTGYGQREEPLCDIITPGKLEKLTAIPVKLMVNFSPSADPSSFMAILNGRNITRYFETGGNGVRAKVGPDQGIEVNLRNQPPGRVNTLKVLVRNKGEERYQNYRVDFFVEVDAIKVIGREGGSLYSPDDRFFITIPPGALMQPTAIALRSENVNSPLGGVYHLSPRDLEFSAPFDLTFRYDRSRLPAGALEDELFLLTDLEFTRRVQNTRQELARQLFTGQSWVLSSFFLSYYKNIGKKLSDIPFTESFRVP
ncbi:MAG: hypothetical protein OEV64_02735, partial [Desulfobulbaceae bacterium]|nr:hypothetical protein [Desulfobulbaceae bacterium]